MKTINQHLKNIKNIRGDKRDIPKIQESVKNGKKRKNKKQKKIPHKINTDRTVTVRGSWFRITGTILSCFPFRGHLPLSRTMAYTSIDGVSENLDSI